MGRWQKDTRNLHGTNSDMLWSSHKRMVSKLVLFTLFVMSTWHLLWVWHVIVHGVTVV